MLQVMMSNRSFLAKTDITRESSSFCSKLPSIMRLYLRVREKNNAFFALQ